MFSHLRRPRRSVWRWLPGASGKPKGSLCTGHSLRHSLPWDARCTLHSRCLLATNNREKSPAGLHCLGALQGHLAGVCWIPHSCHLPLAIFFPPWKVQCMPLCNPLPWSMINVPKWGLLGRWTQCDTRQCAYNRAGQISDSWAREDEWDFPAIPLANTPPLWMDSINQIHQGWQVISSETLLFHFHHW